MLNHGDEPGLTLTLVFEVDLTLELAADIPDADRGLIFRDNAANNLAMRGFKVEASRIQCRVLSSFMMGSKSMIRYKVLAVYSEVD